MVAWACVQSIDDWRCIGLLNRWCCCSILATGVQGWFALDGQQQKPHLSLSLSTLLMCTDALGIDKRGLSSFMDFHYGTMDLFTTCSVRKLSIFLFSLPVFMASGRRIPFIIHWSSGHIHISSFALIHCSLNQIMRYDGLRMTMVVPYWSCQE